MVSHRGGDHVYSAIPTQINKKYNSNIKIMTSPEARLDSQEHKIEELNRKLDKILGYIETDETTGRLGIYAEVRDLDQRVQRIESTMKVSIAKKSVWFFIGGAIVSFIVVLDSLVEFFKNTVK